MEACSNKAAFFIEQGVGQAAADIALSFTSYWDLQNLPRIYVEEQDYAQLLAFFAASQRKPLGIADEIRYPFNSYSDILMNYLNYVLCSVDFLNYTQQCKYGFKMPCLSTIDVRKGLIPLRRKF